MTSSNSKFKFDKDESKIVRGFAILAMILHHTMGLTPGLSDITVRFGASMKICVALFTFLVGYGFYFAKDKTIKGSLIRALKLLIEFWILLFVIFIPIYCVSEGVPKLSVNLIIRNMFGINENLHWFSWYVYFYIYAMIVMPIMAIICNKYKWKGLIGIILCSILFECLAIYINKIPVIRGEIGLAVISCMSYTPVLIVGYYLAKINLFERVPVSIRWIITYTIIAILTVVALQYYRKIFILSLEFIYVPLLILGILSLARFNTANMRNIFIKLGDLSMIMWFIHALFVMPYCRKFTVLSTQWAESSWILTWFCITTISLLIAWTLQPVLNKFSKLLIQKCVR